MSEPFTEQEYTRAATQALQEFSLAGAKLHLVCVSENVTFRVTSPSGDEYALRLHRPGYNTLAELESERLWSAALDRDGIEVQRAHTSSTGRSFVDVHVGAGRVSHYAGLTTWLGGDLLGEQLENMNNSSRNKYFTRIGELVACMHNQTSSWPRPPQFTRPMLDCEGLLGESPRWGRFWEHPALQQADRSLLLALRERLASILHDYGFDASNSGLIHADLHSNNLLITEQGLGVIDFDDTAFGWFVYDLAVVLTEYQDDQEFSTLSQTMLQGYRSLRELSPRDESMLPIFLLVRGCANIGWFSQRPEHAGSEEFDQTLERVLTDGRTLLA